MDPGLRALVWTPLVATLAWYLTALLRLAILNRELRWLQDVVTLGIGAATFGLAISFLVTLFVVAPLHVSLRPVDRVRPGVALVAGAAAGAGVSLAIAWIGGDRSMLPLWQGVLVGLLSAAFWRWRVCREPGARATA